MPSPNLNSEDYYQVLGVARNADDAELKKAYRKLAVKVSHSFDTVLVLTIFLADHLLDSLSSLFPTNE